LILEQFVQLLPPVLPRLEPGFLAHIYLM